MGGGDVVVESVVEAFVLETFVAIGSVGSAPLVIGSGAACKSKETGSVNELFVYDYNHYFLGNRDNETN